MNAPSNSGQPTPGQPTSSAAQTGTAAPVSAETPKRRFPIRIVSIAAILVLALIFIFSNLEQWTLYFLGFSFTGAAWMWFLVLLAAGVLIGLLIPRFGQKHKKQ